MKIRGKFRIEKGCAIVRGHRVPRGRVAFYWQLSHTRGVKVFYGLQSKMETTQDKAFQVYKNMKKLNKEGVAAKPYGFCMVDLDIICGGRRIRKIVPGILVEHCKRHKDKAGLGRFKKKLKKVVKHTGISNCADSFKNVNIRWSKRTKSWRLVDVR